MGFKEIDVNEFEGEIPENHDLVIAEKGNELKSAMWLSGFDEIGMFDFKFVNPVYGFVADFPMEDYPHA